MSGPEQSSAAVVRSAPGFWRRLFASQRREGRRVVLELLQVRGLMPLLMKHRNGGVWTDAERAELLGQLRRLSRLSPYLMLMLLPGSALILPVYAWWLDRRRGQRAGQSVQIR
jgi:hypothetical protein